MAVSSTSRRAALGAVRTVALLAGVVSAAAGIAYAVPTLAGPNVLGVLDGAHSGFVELPVGLRVAHAVAVLLGAATATVMALLLADLVGRVRARVEFVPAVSRTGWALAIVLAAGSWLAQIAENLAVRSGVVYPDTGDPWAMDPATLPLHWELSAWTFIPDLPLLGLALAFALFASIIQSGERLQRDTEGLV